MPDSPALNEKSRTVLVTAPPPPLPLDVPGHGPPAPRPRSPPPPVPSLLDVADHTDSPPALNAGLNAANLRDDYTEEDDGEAEESLMNHNTSASDPYAGLAGAFGGYAADEPKPILNTNGQGEDLLF